MTTNQQIAPDSADLDKMTIAQICLDVSRGAAHAHGLGDITEALVTWAIDIDEEFIKITGQVCPEKLHGIERDPGRLAVCSDTATKLFARLKASDESKGALEDLAAHVACVAADRRSTIFKVSCSNHVFVIVVRNDMAQILQSFQCTHSLGWYLMNHAPLYRPALLQQYLSDIKSPSVQQNLFSSSLSGSFDGAYYEHAQLKPAREIWEKLFKQACNGLSYYRSRQEGRQ
jgi:hypothetical protein